MRVIPWEGAWSGPLVWALYGHGPDVSHVGSTWASLGKPTLYTEARKKVEESLAGPLVDPMPGKVSQDLDEILRAADEELADKNK